MSDCLQPPKAKGMRDCIILCRQFVQRVGNQKKLLTKVAKEKGYTNLLTFCDDGISGVTMQRPGYIEMIDAIEQNKISAVFVKDLSRLGRNYIEVVKLTE